MTTTTTIEQVQNYKGNNSFIIKMKDTISRYNRLTPKQEEVVIGIFQKEKNERTIQVNWPTFGETLVIGRKIGQQLKETYGLEFNPVLIDITRLLGVSPKAVKFSGKMTVKRGKICMCCGRDLSDEFSMLTKMGKTCSSHMKVEYIKDKSEVERFRNDYLKRVEEIGEMEFWIQKSQIKKWNGITESVVKTM
jgi:hypothetical protein|tara:strand:- start:40 stop:615 length:576 start_codon:yes stop_codon:yes gene_type:complete